MTVDQYTSHLIQVLQLLLIAIIFAAGHATEMVMEVKLRSLLAVIL
jgi:hypothetical protein